MTRRNRVEETHCLHWRTRRFGYSRELGQRVITVSQKLPPTNMHLGQASSANPNRKAAGRNATATKFELGCAAMRLLRAGCTDRRLLASPCLWRSRNWPAVGLHRKSDASCFSLCAHRTLDDTGGSCLARLRPECLCFDMRAAGVDSTCSRTAPARSTLGQRCHHAGGVRPKLPKEQGRSSR